MATRLYLDTHGVVWLHQGELDKFGQQARQALENSPLLYAPALLLELQFLFEIGRIGVGPAAILADLQQEIGLTACTHSYLSVMQAACLEDWTRDPFDRAIVAQARLSRSPLLTRDRKIQEHYSAAFW